MVDRGEITERSLESRIIGVLSVRVVSVSQLSKELGVKRYILTGYLEAMKNQGKLTYHKVGKSNCYTLAKSIPRVRGRAFAFIMLLTLGVLYQASIAAAMPTIGDIYMSPSAELWTGESLYMAVNCTDGANGTIAGVFAILSGSGGFNIPNRTMPIASDGSYATTIEALYLKDPSSFTANVFCTGSDATTAVATRLFSVSNLTVDVASLQGAKIYLGSQIELDAQVRKDGTSITSGPTFSITFNGQVRAPKVAPPYDPSRGWLMYFDSPSASGAYDVDVTATVGRASNTDRIKIDIIDPVQFYVSSIDKSVVASGDYVTIQTYAFDHGSVIPINSDILQVKVGSVPATIISITPVSNYFNVVVSLPSLIAGSYSLTSVLSYNGYSFSSSKAVNYAVSVSGKLTDESGHGVSATVRFSQGGNEKIVLFTDSNGGYSGTLPVGDYDIQAAFSHTTMNLYGVTVDGFDDPIKHYFLSSGDIRGVDVAGVYVYEVSIPFRNASLEMKYDESKVANENDLKIYRCDSWSTGKQTCYSGWKEIYGFVDTLRNTVYINTTGLAAFSIGTIKQLSLDYNINKDDYSLRELVKVRGMAIDNFRDPVPNVTVTMRIPEASVSQSAVTDANGLFSFDYPAPGIEGKYTVRLSAELDPFVGVESSSSFRTVKSKDMTLVIPDSLQMAQGDRYVQEFRITNTGQTDLVGLNASLEGMPDGYYSMDGSVGSIKSGESAVVSADIRLPDNASIGTSAVTFIVRGADISAQKVFGFTVTENKSDDRVPVPTTGQFWDIQFPVVPKEILYLTAIAAICFFAAYFLKKRRLSEPRAKEKEVVRKSFSEVKDFMDSQPPDIKTNDMSHDANDMSKEKSVDDEGGSPTDAVGGERFRKTTAN
jgi:hypothetical protein